MAAADRIFHKGQSPSADELATLQACRTTAMASTTQTPQANRPPVATPSPTAAVAPVIAAAQQSSSAFNKDAYDLGCADRVLGMAAADRIFHKGQSPSADELATLESCRTQTTSQRPDGHQETPRPTTEGNKGSQDSQDRSKGTLPNWRELYQIPYTISCMDARLGVAVVRQFEAGQRPPTEEEFETIASCEIERADLLRKSNEQAGSEGGNEAQGSSKTQLANWRELYQLPYTIACMDDHLGPTIVREFQTGQRAPTPAEHEAIASCELSTVVIVAQPSGQSTSESEKKPDRRDDDDDDEDIRSRIEGRGGWIRTGDPKNDQFVLGFIPNAEEWKCGVAAVGESTLRSLKAGQHQLTDAEYQRLEPCFRASPETLIHPLSEFDCIPLDLLLEFVDYYRPSWDQLECHLENIQRYAMPKTQVRYPAAPDPFGIRNNKGPLFPVYWDRIMNDPFYADEVKANFSPSIANMGMPPSYDELYNTIKCHMSSRDASGAYQFEPYWLDESIRGAAIGYLIEKQKGRRIYADLDMCNNVFVVQGGEPADYTILFTSVQDFKDFTLNVTVPAYAMKAKAAERVKAELLQLNNPFGTEIEVVFSQDPFLNSLPVLEQVALAQWYLDTIIPEVRKHFSGTVWVASAANYDDGHPDFPSTGMNPSFGKHWASLSFAGADHVSFTLSASCDFRHTWRHLHIQLATAMDIVQRDNVTWGLYVERLAQDKFGPAFDTNCADDFEARELDMHRLILAQLDEQPIQPYFLFGIIEPPRSWTRAQEGHSPTAAEAGQGDWRIMSLDEREVSPEVRALYDDYVRTHVVGD